MKAKLNKNWNIKDWGRTWKFGYVALVDWPSIFPDFQVLSKWTEKGIYLSIISPDDLIYDRVRGEMRYDK